MPAGIVYVANNTSRTLYYHNIESDYKFFIKPKEEKYENNDWVPISNFRDDTIPFHSSGRYIEIKLDNSPPIKISDDKYQFTLVGYLGVNDREETQQWYVPLENGEKYIIRVDEIIENGIRMPAITILKYDEDKFKKVEAGYVIAQIL